MQAAGIDIIVGCLYQPQHARIVTALQELRYSPKAMVLIELDAAEGYSEEYEYILAPSPWHPSMPGGVGAFSNLTSMQFAAKYSQRFMGDTPSYHAASMFASLCALAAAIENAGTLETSAVAEQLRALSLIEFYGNITFDEHGQASSKELVVLQNTYEDGVGVVPHVVDSSSFVYPMPTWEQRWCRNIGPGKTQADADWDARARSLSEECSGHGKCDGSGACLCETGYAGFDCSRLHMPPGGTVQSFGDFHTSPDGTIVIAGPLSLHDDDAFARPAKEMKQAAIVFSDLMVHRGGLRVGHKQMGVLLNFIGDYSNKTGVEDATKYALGLRADFITGPYSSGLAQAAQLVSDAAHRILMAPESADTSVLGQSNLTFSTLPPPSMYLKSVLHEIAERAEATKHRLKVGFISDDAAVQASICASGLALARESELVAPNETTPTAVLTKPTVQEAKAVLSPMQAAGIDIIVGCLYQPQHARIVTALQELRYSPKAMVLIELDAAEGYSEEYEYILAPSPWHPSMPGGVGAFSNLTSMQFAAKYSQRFMGDTPSYHAASMFASLCALAAAIENAGTLETSAVAEQLRALSLIEFYGNITFDEHGQASSKELVVLQNTYEDGVGVVPHVVDSSSFVYPMPTWEQRWCRNIGPGKNYTDWNSRALSKECSGHGKCDESGACMCETGYAGFDCSQILQDTTMTAALVSVSSMLGAIALYWLLASCRPRAARLVAQIQDSLQRDKRRLRLQRNGNIPEFPLSKELKWHVFLSHKWPTGQDACASIRVQLIERTTPEMGIRVFLDIFDLEDTSLLENYVQQSSCILIFLSRGCDLCVCPSLL